jgi:hypothetical protein
MLLLFFFKTALADCGEALKFRDALPSQDELVPPTATPFLSFIGDGQVDDLEVSFLYGRGEMIVDAEILGRCYDHESYTEFHCNYLITPTENLEPNGIYTIQVKKAGTSNNPPRWNMKVIQVDDGNSTDPIEVETPTLHLLSFIDFVNGAQECDWQETQAYQLMAEIPTIVGRRSLIDVFEINDSGEEYVHSIIINANQEWADFRQVIRPETPLDRCYVIQHRLITGETSEFSEMLCHDGSYIMNSNPRYETDDTGSDIIDDTGDSESNEELENIEENDGPSRQGISFIVEDEGCSSSKSYFWGIPFLLLVYTKRRRKI